MKRWNKRAAAKVAADAAPEGERITINFGGREVLVPYVAAWSSELPDFCVAPEPLLGGKPALFRGSGRRGDGRPVLGKMDVGRQRWCVLRRRCQVCAGPLEGHGWLALIADTPYRIHVPGIGLVQLNREPPACAPCMALSLEVCPGVKRIPNLTICKPAWLTLIETQTVPPIGGFGPLEDDGPELRDPTLRPVCGYIKMYFRQGLERQFTPAEFVALFGGKARAS